MPDTGFGGFGATRHTSRTAVAGCLLAVVAAALVVGGYAGLTMQKLALAPGFKLFLAGIALSVLALLLSLVGWRRTRAARGRRLAWAGIIISLLLVTPMLPNIIAAFTVPSIHDITTDTDNPPAFVDILPLRAAAPNTAEYGGETLAAMQKAAYPEIAPLLLNMPPAEAFALAEMLVQRRGWILAASVPAEGRIEATAQTRMMRFQDDMVIRITPTDAGSRIDMRSVSRFGKSDLGVNAKRIREFLADLGGS